jgi:hypothetical protein
MMENQDATPLAPRATNQRQSAIITRSLDFIKLIPMMSVPIDAMVTGEGADDGSTIYHVHYTHDGQKQTIELGPDRVLAEWAEAILAELSGMHHPHAKRWQHPRPSDLL